MASPHYAPYAEQKSRAEQATDIGYQALDQVTEAAAVARDTVKEHPIATLAAIGGLAFVIGALWKMQPSRKTSHIDSLMERLSELPQKLPKGWRA